MLHTMGNNKIRHNAVHLYSLQIKDHIIYTDRTRTRHDNFHIRNTLLVYIYIPIEPS